MLIIQDSLYTHHTMATYTRTVLVIVVATPKDWSSISNMWSCLSILSGSVVIICDAGLPHPPPPPTPCLCFPRLPGWSCLASSPPPLWSRACGSFWLPVGGSVFYKGMVWLLKLVSSNVIVTCLVPSPPVGWDLWSFWLAPPRLCGAVCSTEV